MGISDTSLQHHHCALNPLFPVARFSLFFCTKHISGHAGQYSEGTMTPPNTAASTAQISLCLKAPLVCWQQTSHDFNPRVCVLFENKSKLRLRALTTDVKRYPVYLCNIGLPHQAKGFLPCLSEWDARGRDDNLGQECFGCSPPCWMRWFPCCAGGFKI